MRYERFLLTMSTMAALMAPPAAAQIVVSANDGKLVLVDGVQQIADAGTRPADSVTVIDFGGAAPRIRGDVEVPTSVIGPPMSVAVAPDESIALVTAAQRPDPANPAATVASDVVSVVDLRTGAPSLAATVHAGAGASGVSINRAGTMALVANRVAGTVSVFTIEGTTVTSVGTVDLGAPDSGPCHVVFTPDGERALVTRNNDNLISVLSIADGTVEYTGRDIAAGLGPYGIEVAPSGAFAVVANIGAGATGGVDTLSLIDLETDWPRAIDHVPVGPIVEGLDISPDGAFVAVTIMNGSNLPSTSPFHHDAGRLRVLAWRDRTLAPVAETAIGQWCQGVTWVQNGDALVAQCMVSRDLRVFGFDGERLTARPTIDLPASPAAIRTADR